MAHALRIAALIGLAAVGLAGCGGSGRSVPPFSMSPSGLGGGEFGNSGRNGVTVRFVEHGGFGIGLVLRNRSRQVLTVLDARTTEPQHSLVQQIGTQLAPWNPPRCVTMSCPYTDGFIGRSFGPARPVAVTVSPGKAVAVQLNYRFVGCSRAASSSTASTTHLDVTYRDRSGGPRSQSFWLGHVRLRPQPPRPNDCLEPHSRIVITGPYATSWAQMVPGSYGDTCTPTTAGQVIYQSAIFESSPMELTVRIVLPRLGGPGLYRTPATAAALGPARVFVTTNSTGQSTFRPSLSAVRVTEISGPTLGGTFNAVVTAYRTPFRVYGSWHCTTLSSVAVGDTKAQVLSLWHGDYLACARCRGRVWRAPTDKPEAIAVRFRNGRVAAVFAVRAQWHGWLSCFFESPSVRQVAPPQPPRCA